MSIPLRALALSSLLLVPTMRSANAAATAPDTSVLEFLGFRAGARLDELARHLRGLGKSKMHCRRSRVDARVNECRAALHQPGLDVPVELWVSAMDSLAGVITLAAVLPPGRLAEWRQLLEGRYGRVGTRSQGAQTMLQWVRRGRMIRLTWKLERGEEVASVSLVDGHVLDAWGRRPRIRATGSAAQPMRRTR